MCKSRKKGNNIFTRVVSSKSNRNSKKMSSARLNLRSNTNSAYCLYRLQCREAEKFFFPNGRQICPICIVRAQEQKVTSHSTNSSSIVEFLCGSFFFVSLFLCIFFLAFLLPLCVCVRLQKWRISVVFTLLSTWFTNSFSHLIGLSGLIEIYMICITLNRQYKHWCVCMLTKRW